MVPGGALVWGVPGRSRRRRPRPGRPASRRGKSWARRMPGASGGGAERRRRNPALRRDARLGVAAGQRVSGGVVMTRSHRPPCVPTLDGRSDSVSSRSRGGRSLRGGRRCGCHGRGLFSYGRGWRRGGSGAEQQREAELRQTVGRIGARLRRAGADDEGGSAVGAGPPPLARRTASRVTRRRAGRRRGPGTSPSGPDGHGGADTTTAGRRSGQVLTALWARWPTRGTLCRLGRDIAESVSRGYGRRSPPE